MIADKIKDKHQIFRGDDVYIYEYSKRNNVFSINDLERIKVEEISPSGNKDGDVIVSGTRSFINSYGKIEEEHCVGVACYVIDGNIVKTSEGNKFVSFYKDKNGKMCLCLRKIKEGYEFSRLMPVFQIDKKIELTVMPYDILCYSEDNIQELVSLLKISYPRLHNGYVSYFLNGKEYITKDVSIYINKINYTGSDGINKVFEWACNNKNPLEETVYNFQKVFSMRHSGYEIKKIGAI